MVKYQIRRTCLIIGGAVMLGIIGGILIFGIQIYSELSEPVEYVRIAEAHEEVPTELVAQATAEVTIEPEVVQIEVVTNWTKERIDQEIDKVFPDVPVMHDVMRCESGGNNDAYNPTNGSHDNGLFQISARYHGQRMRDLGLKVDNPADNIAFARMLYDESGLQPWSASKHCWSK
jgi:hypothetical protein